MTKKAAETSAAFPWKKREMRPEGCCASDQKAARLSQRRADVEVDEQLTVRRLGRAVALMMVVVVRTIARRVDGQLEVTVLAGERPAAAMVVGVTVRVALGMRMIAVVNWTADFIQPALLVAVLAGTAQIVAVNPGTHRPTLGFEDDFTAPMRTPFQCKDIPAIGDTDNVVIVVKVVAGPQVNTRRSDNFNPLTGLRRNFQVTGSVRTRR